MESSDILVHSHWQSPVALPNLSLTTQRSYGAYMKTDWIWHGDHCITV